ncbi:exonuclease domain-containing protein [Mobilicoccus pelagius]|uniref:DNA polymerase III epsilon subunit n=1 Tax=Mobilicoccus pelagius NBRC 104925 TaxID=1089455 RepID=H5UMK0_9MICO|nr:exonuclease domain-containing protein [Mobilicoccus pelagius]GAB46958.1 DNA polymerase III epsilon subunit [Mobilicoccus pelagius NBRC 104925]
MIPGRDRRRRDRARRRVEDGTALARFLDVPAPPRSTPLDEAPLLAVDLETTGLDPRVDRILAVGFVPVDGDEIRLAGARQVLVRHTDGDGVGQSATVHGLTDDALTAGHPLADVLAVLLDELAGRVLLAHYAVLEEEFLAAACRREFGAPLVVPVVDTLELQRRLVAGPYDHPRAGTLRLGRARSHHGLPTYRAHAALTDALACAELYLAQREAFAARGDRALAALLR